MHSYKDDNVEKTREGITKNIQHTTRNYFTTVYTLSIDIRRMATMKMWRPPGLYLKTIWHNFICTFVDRPPD